MYPLVLEPLLRFNDDCESSIGDTVSVDDDEDDDDDEEEEDDDEEEDEDDEEDNDDSVDEAGGVVERPSVGCTDVACCC